MADIAATKSTAVVQDHIRLNIECTTRQLESVTSRIRSDQIGIPRDETLAQGQRTKCGLHHTCR